MIRASITNQLNAAHSQRIIVDGYTTRFIQLDFGV